MVKVRVGFIGLFGIANHHLREVKATPELELGAVCDINETLASSWSEDQQVPWYRNYQDLVESKDCDFVIVSAPHYLHCDIACAAMEAGKPVIIQKPMCLTVAEADRIIATAKRTGVKVGTYHTAHTSEWDAITMVRSGQLGHIMRFSFDIHAARGMSYYNSGPWRGKWATEGSGALSNQRIHDINRMQSLNGAVAEVVSCTLANMGHPGTEVEDACAATLRFENGSFGLFHTSLYTALPLSRYEIVGNEGCIVVNDQERKWGKLAFPMRDYLLQPKAARKPGATLEDAPRPGLAWEPLPAVEQPMETTRWFALSVAEDKPIQAPPEFALRDIEVWNAMILSHFRNRPVKLPVDRGEYDELFEELKAGKHDLHWPAPWLA